jgi:hypothetical protein
VERLGAYKITAARAIRRMALGTGRPIELRAQAPSGRAIVAAPA